MDFFDTHVHFLGAGSLDEIKPRWQPLIHSGLRGIAGIVKAHPPHERERYLKLIPKAYHHLVDLNFMGEELGSQLAVARALMEREVFPYLDCRFLSQEDSDLSAFREAGFRGLKVLYIPEEDRQLGLAGWENFFGRSKAESEKMVGRMIGQAVSFRWPVIFHAHLKQYGEFAKEILETFPSHPFIIPHFGFSRKIIAHFMERFDQCYSDFSSLLPYMKDDPEGYKDFITVFQDRILFGTDTSLSQPDIITNYYNFTVTLIIDREIQKKILSGNYLRIHS